MIMKIFRAAVCIMVVWLVLAGRTASAEINQARNEIVIVVDATDSFRSRQTEAVERTVALLDGIASRELRRWEDNKDRVVIISLDALPEVVWSGSLGDLKAAASTSWAERFRARADYAKCTDVGAAFNLATRYLEGDPREVSRYLFAFSDLIDEPPTTSIRQCRPARVPSPPPEDFPWEKLQGVAVNIFWVPADQKLLWSRAAEQHGLKDSLALFTTSESAVVPVVPPKPAQLAPEVVEEQRKEMSQQVKEFGGKIIKKAGAVLASIFLLLSLAILAALLLSRRRSSHQRPAPAQVGRRITGPVPPLNPAGRQRPRIVPPGDNGRRA
jgi:hypothetical protein